MPDDGILEVLPAAEWDESLQPVVEDMNGRPLNVHGLIANNPNLLKAWWSFRQHIVSAGALDARSAELVILRTAVHAGAEYEWLCHVERGHAAGLSFEEIERVMAGPKDAGWSDADALLLRAVDELAANKGLLPDTRDTLAQAIGASATLDLIAIHGAYVMLACMLNTWDVDLDEHVAARLKASGYK